MGSKRLAPYNWGAAIASKGSTQMLRLGSNTEICSERGGVFGGMLCLTGPKKG